MNDKKLKKVLFLTNVPSPYRVEFFNELGKHCDLTVAFEKRSSDERDDSWKEYSFESFKGVFLKGISVRTDAAVCPDVVDVIKKGGYEHIIVTNFSSPTGIIAINYMKRKRIPYCVECDGAVAGSGKGVKERIKRYVLGGAEKYYSTGASSDEYYLAYGASKERIVRYPFTSLRNADVETDIASLSEKAVLREKYGLSGEKIIVTVGRFSYKGGYGKGFDIVVKAADNLKPSGVYIIGDEPTEEFLEMRKEYSADNVTFVSYLDKATLREYYRAADVFVLMTRGDAWGLVVNEAMSCGLPIITTDKCVAGLELVEDDVNGYIVKSEDMAALIKYATDILNDGEKRAEMGRRSLERIKNYTIERMAEIHIEEMEKSK